MNTKNKVFFERRQKVIKLAKYSLMALAFMLVMALFLWPYAVKQKNFLESMMTQNYFGSSGSAKIDMTKVQFFSTDSNGNPFTVHASKVLEVDTQSAVVRLDRPNGEMAFDNGVKLYMTSPYAFLHQRTENLIFEKEVKVVSDNGYVANVSGVTLNYKQRTARSSQNVSVRGEKGSITSEGFYFFDAGESLNFYGKTNAVITGNKNHSDIHIYSSKTMFLRKQDKSIRAIQHASLSDKTYKLLADDIKVYFEQTEKGKYQPVRMEAFGNVFFETPTTQMRGQKAFVNLKEEVGILEEDASVKERTNTLFGEKITAFLKTDEEGKQHLKHVEAEENVRIKTLSDEVFGDKAVYTVATEQSVITGNVKIIHNGVEMKGEKATTNMKTGISTLEGNSSGQNGRIRGTFFPTILKEESKK